MSFWRQRKRQPWALRPGELPPGWIVARASELDRIDQNAAYRMMLYQLHGKNRWRQPAYLFGPSRITWYFLALLLLFLIPSTYVLWRENTSFWQSLHGAYPGYTIFRSWIFMFRIAPWRISQMGISLLILLGVVQFVTVLAIFMGALFSKQQWPFLAPPELQQANLMEALGLTPKRHGGKPQNFQPMRDLQLSALNGRDIAIAIWATTETTSSRRHIFFWLMLAATSSIAAAGVSWLFALPMGAILPALVLFAVAWELVTWSTPYTTLSRCASMPRLMRLLIVDPKQLRKQVVLVTIIVTAVVLLLFLLGRVPPQTPATLPPPFVPYEPQWNPMVLAAQTSAIGALTGYLFLRRNRRRKDEILSRMADDLDAIFDRYRDWD